MSEGEAVLRAPAPERGREDVAERSALAGGVPGWLAGTPGFLALLALYIGAHVVLRLLLSPGVTLDDSREVLLGQVLARDGLAVVPTATVVGVLAAVAQFLGLARWPFLVPALARTYHDPASSDATRDASVVVFESFHRYLGVAVGECLGYFFTGAWTVLVGIAMLQSSAFEAWFALPGIAIGVLLVAASFEFVGRFEEKGWKLAGSIVPIAYIAWSVWLIGAGLVLLFS